MSKKMKTSLLVLSVMFSLSALPGLNADAGSERMDLSSNATYEGDCDFDDYSIKEQGKTCKARLRSDSATQANISARVVQVPKKRRLSDPAPAAGEATTEEMLEVSIEATSSVAGCTTGCSRNSSVTRRFPIDDARNVAAKALKEFESEAERLRGEAAQAAEKQKRLDKCEVGTNDQPLEGRAKRDCLVRRLSQIRDPEAAARFYDENLKQMIADMIRSGNPQTVEDAKQMLLAIDRSHPTNPYLKPAIIDMARFHKFHGDLSQAIQEYNSIPNDRNPANVQRRAQLAQDIKRYYESGVQYFSDRIPGIQKMESDLAARGWGYTGTLGQDAETYRQDLEGVYEDHANRMGVGTQGTNNQFQQRQPGAPGTGRGQFLNRNGQQQRGLTPTRPLVQGPGSTVPARPGTTPVRPGQANPFGQPRVFGGKAP